MAYVVKGNSGKFCAAENFFLRWVCRIPTGHAHLEFEIVVGGVFEEHGLLFAI